VPQFAYGMCLTFHYPFLLHCDTVAQSGYYIQDESGWLFCVCGDKDEVDRTMYILKIC